MPAIGRKKVVLHPLPSASDLLGPHHLPTPKELSTPDEVEDGGEGAAAPEDAAGQINGEPSSPSKRTTKASSSKVDPDTPLKELRERHLREHVRKLNAQRQQANDGAVGAAGSSSASKGKKAGTGAVWEEPEVYLVEETGEVFLEYECVPQARSTPVILASWLTPCWPSRALSENTSIGSCS